MKKIFLVILISFLSANIPAVNNNWIEMEDKNLTKEQAIEQLVNEYRLFDSSELLLSRAVEDNIGMIHYTYQQYIDGIKVEGCYLLVHTREGIVSTVNGSLLDADNTPQERSYMPRKQIRVKYNLSEAKNIEPLIFEFKGVFRSAYKYFDDERYSNVYVDAKTGEEIVAIPTMNYEDTQGSATTFYNGIKSITCNSYSNYYNLLDNARNIYTVNATQFDGNVNSLNDWENSSTTWNKPILAYVTIEWAAEDWWYNSLTDTKPDLYIQISSGGTILYTSGYLDDTDLPVTFLILPNIVEADGNLKIEVLDYDPLGDDSAGKVSITKTTAGTYSWNNSKTRATYKLINNPAHDAHWGMEKVYDFFMDKFNHRSYDGNGSQILQVVNPPSSFCPIDNAIANYGNGSYFITYGLGDGINTNPVVQLDVMGHEFTHLVTAASGEHNLPNYGEGGALNESFGDIMGNAIEAYALGSTDWVFMKGKNCSDASKYDRSLKSPKTDESFQRPNTYKGDYWRTVTGNPNSLPLNEGGNDMDWVHINCGVQDFWFYLLSQGGSGHIDDKQANDNYSVIGIGIDKAIQIVYRNLMTYITSNSQYSDSRKGSIKAAIDLYGRNSQEHQSVMNAWHAVGVGNKYVAPSEEFELNPGKYIIVANRDKDGDKNWYYMTADLGTASNKRFQAVSTNTDNLVDIVTEELEDKYIWELVEDGENWKLMNGSNYVTWNSGNSANLAATGKALTCDVTGNAVQIHFNDGTAERYLAMNQTTGNNYFAFYTGTNLIRDLVFLPYEEKIVPPVRDCKDIPYTETFASSQGEFSIQNVTLPSGFTSIWNWDSRYGMVAKCIKGSTKYESESYLISPCIELPENEPCVLTFSHAAKFFQSTDQMSLWISTNYDESDPESAQWNRLVIPNYPTGTNWNWYESGDIDLSAYSGQGVNIAFCYTSTTSYAPQWEIKNFAVNPSTATLIESVQPTQSSATKVLRNGQLFILRDGKTYTVQGQEVR